MNTNLREISAVCLTLLITGCSSLIPTGNPVAPIKSIITENQDLEKEYTFKTKALTLSYFKRKLDHWLDTENNFANIKVPQLIKELRFAMAKGEGDLPYQELMCQYPYLFEKINMIDEVNTLMNTEPAFGVFINSANCSAPGGDVIYVNVNVPSGGNNDGTSWANAYTSLQDALTNATSGNEIWVAEGTYTPDSSDRAISFQMKNGVNIYGGFAGTESLLTERNIIDNPVILSGDLNSDDNPADVLNESTPNKTDNSLHIVKGADSSILDGVTIKYGYADGSGADIFGGGMYNKDVNPALVNITFSGNYGQEAGGMFNENSSPTINSSTFSDNFSTDGGGILNYYNSSPVINNVVFTSNKVSVNGGGIYNFIDCSPVITNSTFSNNSARNGGGMINENSSPTITNVVFSGNSAIANGGGMNNYGSSPTITNATFSNNFADNGGGIYNGGDNGGSSPTITNSTFSGNSVLNQGGGISNNNNSSPTITNATFSNNFADFGGGMFNDGSSPTITNSTFSGNYVLDQGGGISNNNNSSPTITNSTFSGNSGNIGGGISNNNNSSPTITNSTFSGNSVLDQGGGISNNNNSSPTIKNSILWGNTALSDANIFNNGLTAIVTYTDIEGGYSGTGNISLDPHFQYLLNQGSVFDLDGADDILRNSDDGLALQSDSPAINAGTTSGAPATDITGKTRDAQPDMGAYEF
jgi:hypothetical protein